MSPRTARFSLPLSFATVVVVAATAGCSGQGAGELCNFQAGNGGNDDCASGLTCQPRPATVNVAGFGICCPQAGPSSAAACSANGTASDASPAPVFPEAGADVPVDGPPGAEPAADGPIESGSEAGAIADASEGGATADASEAGAPADASEAGATADASEDGATVDGSGAAIGSE